MQVESGFGKRPATLLTRQTIRMRKLERHVHTEPYAALVLCGGYEEAGDNGRFAVKAGTVVFHDRFEAHLDRFSREGATVLNLGLTGHCDCPAGIASVADPDLVARVAERSQEAAVELLLSQGTRWTPQPSDWPDELAERLRQDSCQRLSEWAEEKGLAPWTLSRGFAQVFGVSPEGFRARVRARQRIEQTQIPLATIAVELGFADQAHMSRSVLLLTGQGPRARRRTANGFKTAAPATV